VLELSLITKEVFNFLTKCSDFIYSGKSFGSPFSTFAYIIYFIYSILRLPSLLARGCTTLYHLFTSHRLYHTVLRSVWRFFQTSTYLLALFRIEEIRGFCREEKRNKFLFLQCRPWRETHCLISLLDLIIQNLRRLIAQRSFVQFAEI